MPKSILSGAAIRWLYRSVVVVLAAGGLAACSDLQIPRVSFDFLNGFGDGITLLFRFMAAASVGSLIVELNEGVTYLLGFFFGSVSFLAGALLLASP